MWCIKATVRERATTAAAVAAGRNYGGIKNLSKRSFGDAVACQLDYYMSPQFAGIAVALVNNSYAEKGITDLTFLPTCPVGLEQQRVRHYQDENPKTTAATIGSVEQNIFVPTLLAKPSLKTTAVAAMFERSPLCIASLESLNDGHVIGCHEDTVSLLKRIFPNNKVIASPRATKNSDLLSGKLGGIQAYTTTEVPALNRLLVEKKKSSSAQVVATPLEGLNGTRLGYSQVLFAANECLDSGYCREIVLTFFA